MRPASMGAGRSETGTVLQATAGPPADPVSTAVSGPGKPASGRDPGHADGRGAGVGADDGPDVANQHFSSRMDAVEHPHELVDVGGVRTEHGEPGNVAGGLDLPGQVAQRAAARALLGFLLDFTVPDLDDR